MKVFYKFFFILFLAGFVNSLFSQNVENCFLEDFELKTAALPPYEDVEKITDTEAVTVTVNSADTLGKISKYIFGNAIAVWMSDNVNNATVRNYLSKLNLSHIRFPGGSWSDVYFWNGNPGDLPNTIPDGQNSGAPIPLYPQFGPTHVNTPDVYYDMRDKLGTQGLITINYGYARYGLSEKPAEQAAHLAADWVRYDKGRTKFWEIGNENAGPWEAGFQIDTTRNKDGQPEIITGELYGKHFKIYCDSMRAAAAEVGATIYIGGQLIQYDGTNSWNVADRKWNEGFLKESGSLADFFVIHNYFGKSSITLRLQIESAKTEINNNINFVRQDMLAKGIPVKPVALTEWNCGGPDEAKTSIANGMQAVVVFNEMIKNNFGLSARWLVANWEADGLLYIGNNSSIPKWTPRPDYFYLYYLNKFTGDHVVSTSVTGSSDILAYASKFSSGEECVILVNKSKTDKVVKIDPKDFSTADKYFVYSLVGEEAKDFAQTVMINDEGPGSNEWGPFSVLETIPAKAYPSADGIKVYVPARSVQYIMLTSKSTSVGDGNNAGGLNNFYLAQNYPNPFNPTTKIRYTVPLVRANCNSPLQNVLLKIYDILGNEVAILVNEEKPAGEYEVEFDGSKLASGIYIYKLQTEKYSAARKLVLMK